MIEKSEKTEFSEEVPVFSSWKGWYILVLSTLAVLIGLFYLFTIAFD